MAARSRIGSGEQARRGRQGARLQAQPQPGDSGPTAAIHSLCRGCLSRAVPEAGLGLGLGLACPVCRRTDTSRAAAPLWQRGRRRKQQGRRRQQETTEQRPEPEPVFRAPLVLSKAGDVRDGYENQLRQYETEKESLKEDDETVTAEIIQIILAEGEQEKQQMEKKKAILEQVKRDEELARKWSREFANDNMSDSENEEPVKRMPTRQWGSAANNKLRSNSSGRMTSMLLANTEENRSGSTPVENYQNRKVTPRSDSRTKTASVSSNSLSTNILASSENSRSNSAPSLSSEKRTLSDPVLSCSVKRERSVSPDSNDSISGELNHFKPIICSPCTPPKKLPDGRLLKPKIVKSTPRNLQKPNTTTTYDVNPNILEKWGQILQDRQEEKTASKGTLTSEEEEEEEISGLALAKASCSPGPGGVGCSGPWTAPRPVDYSDSTEVPESSFEVSVEWETTEKPRSVLDEDTEQENGPHHNSKKLFPPHAAKKRSKGHVTTGSSTASGSGSKGASSYLHRKRKRQQKSNYTAAYRSKRAKWNAMGNTSTANLASLTSLHQTQQEEEDRKLAFRLQRQFDVERTTVNRQKGSEDGYPLRTKANTRTKKQDWDH